MLTPPAEFASGAVWAKDWISEIPLESVEPIFCFNSDMDSLIL